MKILHTSDWHLGKKLEGHSRIDEQEKFIDEIIDIANEKEVDLVIIAGDIYDTPHPSSEAERLYFEGIKRLSKQGRRAVVIIAGNHDSPDKLLASDTLSREFGIITFGRPLEKKELGSYGRFEVVEAYQGAIVLKIDEKEVFINALPYPSEKTLNEVWEVEGDEGRSYSERIGTLLNETHNNKREKLKSIIISHLFTTGVQNEGSEREIELGGSLAFNLDLLPQADYTALGHIHKSINFTSHNCVYSGSPMEFRISESKFDKKVFIKDLDSGELEQVLLTKHKEIKAYTLFSIEEAIEKSHELIDKNQWIYFYIETDRPLTNKETREIKKNKGIIEIIPRIDWKDRDEFSIEQYTEENIKEAFDSFYKNERNVDVPQGVKEAFWQLIGEVDDETN